MTGILNFEIMKCGDLLYNEINIEKKESEITILNLVVTSSNSGGEGVSQEMSV